MASSTTSQRAVTAGLSCGIGLAVPVIAYAATLPFEGVHEVVSAAAVPFAIGAVAGVAVHTVSGVVADAAAERRREEDEAWERSFSARTAAASRAEDAVANVYGGADYTAAIPREGLDAAEESQPRRRVFTHIGRVKEDDVPVIARADTGYASDDPWAQIMEEELEGSPYSCDPATSKDVYQIAIEELSHTGETGQMKGDEIAAAARAAAGMASAPAGTTAAFIAMASAANAQAAQRAQSPDAWTTDTWTAAAASYDSISKQPSQAEWAAEAEVSAQAQLEAEEATRVNEARDAAMASLGGVRPNIETMAAPVSEFAPAAAAPQEVVEIPMVDYSGHESMWAAALDILAEDEPKVEAAPVSQETRALSLDELAGRSGEARPDTSASRSRDYLHVIEGGTNPFPRLAI